MVIDVTSLRSFYNTQNGQRVAASLTKAVAQNSHFFPDYIVAGLGYCQPFIDQDVLEINRYVQFMPAQMGATQWMGKDGNISALAYDNQLPVPDMALDGLVVGHWLEHCNDIPELLAEAWRCLNGTGQLLLIVPARRGLWVYDDSTPFGQGRPFSSAQIRQYLDQAGFECRSISRYLYWPPKAKQRMIGLCEWLLPKVAPRLAGVLVIDACKIIYAHRQRGTKIRIPDLLALQPRPAVARAVDQHLFMAKNNCK